MPRSVKAVSLLIVTLLLATLVAACTTSSPAPSPSASPSASPKASSPAPSASPSASSSASASPSASTKAPTADELAYQKFLDTDWKKVTDDARKEKDTVIYVVGAPDATTLLQNEFNKIDPLIQVKLLIIVAAQATERIRGENATKQYIGSIYMGGTVRPMSEEGLGQPMDLAVLHDPSIKWIIDPRDPPLQTMAYSFNLYNIIVNNNLVPPGQEPKTWADLGDPKWKNKLALWDPKTTGTGQSLLAMLYASPAHGPDLVKKIIDNTVITAGPNDGAQLVAKGELPISLASYGAYNTVKDGPVRMTRPSDGAIGNTLFALLLKNAPQPNTAKLYMNWMLSPAGQKIQGMGYSTIRSDVIGEAAAAQVGSAKFLPGLPVSVEQELRGEAPVRALITQWVKDAGK